MKGRAAGARGGRGPAFRVHTIGNHHQALLRHTEADQYIGLQLREHDHPVVTRQGRGIKLIRELLGASGDVAQPRIEGGVKGGHQWHTKLLAEVRQAEIKGGESEAGVDDVRLQPFQGVPQLPLRPWGGDGVNLRFDQIRQADVRIVGQQ